MFSLFDENTHGQHARIQAKSMSPQELHLWRSSFLNRSWLKNTIDRLKDVLLMIRNGDIEALRQQKHRMSKLDLVINLVDQTIIDPKNARKTVVVDVEALIPDPFSTLRSYTATSMAWRRSSKMWRSNSISNMVTTLAEIAPHTDMCMNDNLLLLMLQFWVQRGDDKVACECLSRFMKDFEMGKMWRRAWHNELSTYHFNETLNDQFRNENRGNMPIHFLSILLVALIRTGHPRFYLSIARYPYDSVRAESYQKPTIKYRNH